MKFIESLSEIGGQTPKKVNLPIFKNSDKNMIEYEEEISLESFFLSLNSFYISYTYLIKLPICLN